MRACQMHSDAAYTAEINLFFPSNSLPPGASIFITLDVRISISRRCTTGRRGNKFLRGTAGYTRYVRIIPLAGQHPKSVPDNAYSPAYKVQSRVYSQRCTRFHFNCADNISRCAHAHGDFISILSGDRAITLII